MTEGTPLFEVLNRGDLDAKRKPEKLHEDRGQLHEADGADLPERPATPCETCGSPGFWESIYGEILCGDCDPWPLKAAVARVLLVAGLPDQLRWVDVGKPQESIRRRLAQLRTDF